MKNKKHLKWGLEESRGDGMNSGVQFKKISLILAFLLFTSMLSILLVPAPSTVVAQASYSIITQGQSNQYNTDVSGPPPWKWYVAGDRPPIMAAKRVGSGAVVLGTVPTCRNTRWTSGEWDVLLDKAFQWMVPGADNVLWYQGYAVYNDNIRCSDLITALRNKGYDIDADNTEPIVAGLLAPYDILVIPQFQLGPAGTGGDPDLLPDGDVSVIKYWVENGGGLLIMEGSDFYAQQYYKVQNKILKALDMGIYFQSDTISPNSGGYSYADVDVTTEIGAAYQAATGKTTVRMYSACSLAELNYYVIVSISPLGRSGEAGENLTYTVTVSNEGKYDDNYTLKVTVDNVNWVASIVPENVSAKVGEENTATLSIKIPDNAAPGDYIWATVTATSHGNENIKDNERAGAEMRVKPRIKKWAVASKLFPEPPVYGVTVGGAGENIYITNTSRVVRYNTTADLWEDVSVPGQFMNGSCLLWDNGNYIYALGGGSYSMCIDPGRRNYKFYRYDISNDNWTSLANTPWYQGPGDALTWVKIGDNEYIYAFFGSSSSAANPNGWYYYPQGVQFWRYNIAYDNWDENLTPNPYGADDGASLAWTGGDNIYAFPGAYDEGLSDPGERHFLRYSISGNNWVEMAMTPYNAGGGVDDGGSLAYPGSGDYIYALKGGDDGGSVPGDIFWGYSISENNWEILQNIPAGVGDNNGHRLGVANGNIYCWRGSFGDGTLWVYSLSGRDVDVSISPENKNGMPGATLEYMVTVKNTGTENDNYKLENTDTKGWTLGLSKGLLENIAPGENENVTLTVTIPENAEYCTEDKITVTATSLVDPWVSDSDNCIAHQGYFIKENVPDLGQHCENWCWAAAAANSIWWYANHGYPQLIDNLENAESDNEWIDQWYTCPVCGQYRKLLAVIASHCLGLPPENTWCRSITDNQYFYGLREFIQEQGAPLNVQEIVDPAHFPPENIPPQSENVVYAQPTFDNYREQLLRCQDVLLWLDLDYEPIDHVVTGVSLFENQWIEVSDPWSTGMPDHNNDNENIQYDNCTVISEMPFRITVPSYGQPATVVKMVYISLIPWMGTATFKLENLYKVSLSKDLQLYLGSKLVVKFYKYDGITLQAESAIENFAPPRTILENENVPHPSGLVPVEIVRLVLTTDSTENEIPPTIGSFTVTKSVLFKRYGDIKKEYVKPGADRSALFKEYGDIKKQYAKAP